MNKSTFGLLATVAFTIAPTAVFAQAQTSIQTNTNSASAVGDANLLIQNATQNNTQTRFGINNYPNLPTQTSVQGNVNAGAAIGNYNVIDQNGVQSNVQTQIDTTQYLPAITNYTGQ